MRVLAACRKQVSYLQYRVEGGRGSRETASYHPLAAVGSACAISSGF